MCNQVNLKAATCSTNTHTHTQGELRADTSGRLEMTRSDAGEEPLKKGKKKNLNDAHLSTHRPRNSSVSFRWKCGRRIDAVVFVTRANARVCV